jgi:hypothetical protein
MASCNFLVQECRSKKIILSPNKAAFPNRSEVVEREVEVDRQQLNTRDPHSSACVCDIQDTAPNRTNLITEEQSCLLQQDVRPGERSSLRSAGVCYGVENRLIHERDPFAIRAKSRAEEYGRFPRAPFEGRPGSAMPDQKLTRCCATPQRESRVKLDARDPG